MVRIDGVGEVGEVFPDWLEALVLALIVANVAIALAETEPGLPDRWRAGFAAFDQFSMVVFSIECLARWWLSPRLPGLGTGWRARWRYLWTPFAIIDFLSVVPFYLPLLLPGDLRMLRMARLVRLFRLLKLARYLRSVTIIRSVLSAKREELLVSFGLGFALLLATATMVYHAEHDAQPDKFPSIASSIWWAVATLTTIGYGDVYPVTAVGKALAAVVAVLGIGLFALPAGILSAGFTEHLTHGATAAKEPRHCPHCGARL